MKILLAGINAKYIHVSLAIYTLASSCRQLGREVDTAEYTINQEFLQILGDIADRRPDVVGFACYVWNREMILRLATALKKILPSIMIVLGGPEVSESASEVLSECRSVDFVVQGEGEESLPELFRQIEIGLNPVNVAGVAFRLENDICLGGGVRVVNDLDKLPFPYSETPIESLRNRILYYESSRGCPFACSYCVSGASAGVRRRSLGLVKGELRFFLKHGIPQVKFVDRTFNVHPAHYRQVWRFLLDEPGHTGFHFEIVADLLTEEDLECLSLAPKGKFQFEIGIQSTQPDTLEAIGRKNSWELLAKNVGKIAQLGNIHLHLDLIVGLPREGLLGFANSFNATYALHPNMLQIGFLKLLPGTRIRREAEQYLYRWLDQPPYEILSNHVLSYTEIRQLKILEEVFNQTYNSGRFSNALSYLVQVCEAGDAFAFYRKLSQWWYEQGLIGTAQSPETVLTQLVRFSDKLTPLQQKWTMELLKVDVLLEGRKSLKGECLPWNEERWSKDKSHLWRSEIEMRRYAPDYEFTNWRDVKRRYPIEVFAVPVTSWLTNRVADGEAWTPVLFEMNQTDVQWHSLPQSNFSSEESL